MKVSVIVPVYKVEQYLRRCLDSLVSQSCKDMEVILVDDGSPDNCGVICDEYAEMYPYIRVIHQDNAGQAAARNAAAKVAAGDYIAYVDSDDFVESDYLEYMIDLLESHEAEMAMGGFEYLYEGREPKTRDADGQAIVMGPCEALIRMNYNKGIGSMPWAKLFKRELILDHPFPEGQIYEDLAVMYRIVGDCRSIAYGNKLIYHWLQRQGSTMRMSFDERQMAGMDAVSEQIDYVRERYPEALSSVKFRYTAKAIELIAVCFNSGGDKMVFKRLRSLMNKYAGEVLLDKNTKATMKARIVAARLGYYPAKAVFLLHERAKKQLI